MFLCKSIYQIPSILLNKITEIEENGNNLDRIMIEEVCDHVRMD